MTVSPATPERTGKLSPMADAWQQVNYVKPEAHKLWRAGHTATVVDGRVLVLAGRRSNSYLSDMVWYDPATTVWSTPQRVPWPRCANHTATLVGRQVWVLGGGDTKVLYGEARVYDCDRGKWYCPTLTGDTQLLFRTAHGAALHPSRPATIVLFGGYGGGPSADWTWLNDLVLVHTDRRVVEALPATGVPPAPRSYHSFTAVGSRLFVLGGRTQAGPAEGAELLACFDTSDDRWRPSVPASGRPPCARSSHRAVAYGGHLLVCGGVTAEDGPGRLADVWVLLGAGGGGGQEGGGGGKMRWQQLAVPAGLTGRSAQGLVLLGDRQLLLLFGYAGAAAPPDAVSKYLDDVWACDLSAYDLMAQQVACDGGPAGAKGPAAGVAVEGGGQGAKGQQQQGGGGGGSRRTPAAPGTKEQQKQQQQQQPGTTPSPFKHPMADNPKQQSATKPAAAGGEAGGRRSPAPRHISPLAQLLAPLTAAPAAPEFGDAQQQQQQQQQQQVGTGAAASPLNKRGRGGGAGTAKAATAATGAGGGAGPAASEWRAAKRSRAAAAPPPSSAAAAAAAAAGGGGGGGVGLAGSSCAGGDEQVTADPYQFEAGLQQYQQQQQQRGVLPSSPQHNGGGRRHHAQQQQGAGGVCEVCGGPAPGACGRSVSCELGVLQQEVDHLRRLLCDSERARSAAEGALSAARQTAAEAAEAAAAARDKAAGAVAESMAAQQDARHLRAQLEGETKARGAAQAAAEAASRQVADANNALKQQQSNMQSLRAEARKRQLELSELQQERERSEVALRAELERARSVAAQEAERGASLAAEVEAGRASLKQQEEHIRRLTATLTSEREAADRAARDAEARLAAAASNLAAEKERVRAAEKAAAGEAAARAAYEAQLVAVQGQLQPLLAELEAKKAAHAADQAAAARQAAALQADLDAARARCTQQEASLTRLRDQFAREGAALSQVTSVVERLRAEREALGVVGGAGGAGGVVGGQAGPGGSSHRGDRV